jgi:ankyrin repeat protein
LCERDFNDMIVFDPWRGAIFMTRTIARITALLLFLFFIAAGNHMSFAQDAEKPTLHSAAAACNRQLVETLLSQGAAVNEKDDNGNTPLHVAANKNCNDVVELLLSKGADMNALNKMGFTPLLSALNFGRTDMGKLLLSKGAKPDIFAAAALCDKNLLEKLISEGASPVDADINKFTPLHWAALTGCTQTAEILIDKGANVNINSHGGGFSPLFVAIIANATTRVDASAVIELLLDKGADVNVKDDKKGFTPLLAALLVGADESIVKLLIEKGADVNAKENELGAGALHFAVAKGYMNIVELLVSRGADVNAKTINGETPLKAAEDAGATEIADFLRAHGAK